MNFAYAGGGSGGTGLSASISVSLSDLEAFAMTLSKSQQAALGYSIAASSMGDPGESGEGGSGTGQGSTNGVGNPVKIEGRGSTGRTIPNNINEQVAMEQVKSNPLNGATDTKLTLGDTRWPSSEGWTKMQNIVTTSDGSKVTIHFNYNPNGKLFDDFKFVFPK